MSDIFEKKVQFFESNRKKGPIPQFIRRFCCSKSFRVQFFESFCAECSIHWVKFQKRFNSLGHIQTKVRFFESFQQNLCHSEKKNSLLWVNKKVQFCESHSRKIQIFESYSKKVQFFESKNHENFSILWVIFKKGLNSLSHQNKVCIIWLIFSEINYSNNLFFKKKKELFLSDIFWKRKVKSSSHLWREGSILCVLWVIFFDKTILWVIITQ